jgi:MoxR-like ATPase
MIDYIFENIPKYILIDEIDKMQNTDQAFLLNLMETGIVSETKHQKTRRQRLGSLLVAMTQTTLFQPSGLDSS